MIQIEAITTFNRARQATRRQVDALTESIREVGLLNPITVCATEGGYALVAGLHRLEACRALGWEEIPAVVVELGEQQRIIAECDENLCASSLTAAERAEFTRRRKEAYEALHPETRREATLMRGGEAPSRQVGETGNVTRFTADTAAKTGQSERAVQRDAERGEKVCDEAMALIRNTRLDTGRYLDEIKNLSPEDQVARVGSDLAQPVSAPKPKERGKAANTESQLSLDVLAEEHAAFAVEVVSLRGKLATCTRERDDLKARNAELADSDQGKVISRLQGQIAGLKYKLANAEDAAKRAEFKQKQAEKRVKELESLEINFG